MAVSNRRRSPRRRARSRGVSSLCARSRSTSTWPASSGRRSIRRSSTTAARAFASATRCRRPSPERSRASTCTRGTSSSPGMVLARLLPLPSPLLDPRSRQVAEQHLASAIDAQRQAEATVTRAETAADQARRDLARAEALAKQGALPPAQLDQATADARMREAELSSAHFSEKVAAHDIEQARAALERFAPGARPSEQFEVTSPVHGQVLHVLHKSEGVVEAGTALLEVGDPRALELVVDVLSQDAVAVRPGMPARVASLGERATAHARRCAASSRPRSPRPPRSASTSSASTSSSTRTGHRRSGVRSATASPPRSRSRSGRSPTSCRCRRARSSARVRDGRSSP